MIQSSNNSNFHGHVLAYSFRYKLPPCCKLKNSLKSKIVSNYFNSRLFMERLFVFFEKTIKKLEIERRLIVRSPKIRGSQLQLRSIWKHDFQNISQDQRVLINLKHSKNMLNISNATDKRTVFALIILELNIL